MDPVTAAAEFARGGLPSPLTSFVGRRRATTALKRALAESRLVTLTGVGGVGKTRLALHVAHAVRRGFADGVRLVELANLGDPALVPDAVIDALGLPDHSTRHVHQVLVQYLTDKRLLIVLDNCEHLLDACGRLVAELLPAAPGLRVLATSREPLNIAGECAWPVPPLSVPRAEDVAEGRWSASSYEALTLFQERAAAVLPEFTLDDRTLPAVARLCARLDGVPLAIELAAVRLRALSVEQILGRLEDRFQLLTEGNRAAPPRHQTLRAAVEWSYDLCVEQDRTLWARCAVFPGEFDLDAAEAICAGDGLTRGDVFDAIAGLVDKSILTRIESSRLSRYRMHDTIRQFGLDRLAESGATTQLRRRHRDYYLELAERADAASAGPDQVRWAERLRAERANLWSALDHCLAEPGEATNALRLCSALWFYWMACGFVRDGRQWLDRALAADTEPSPERMRALLIAGSVSLAQGHNAYGVKRLDECLRLARRMHDPETTSHATLLLTAAAMFDNDPARAAPQLDRVLADHRETGKWTGIALIGFPQRGLAAVMLGDVETATDLFDECRAICADLGERWALSWMTWVLGLAYWTSGDTAAASARLRDALTQMRDLGDEMGIAFCTELLAWVATARADHRRAAMLFGAVDAMWAMVGRPLFGFPSLIERSERLREQAREAMGGSVFAEQAAEGARLNRQDVVAVALNARHRRTSRPAQAPASTSAELTKREREVAALVAKGLSNKDIAARLVISKRTAEAHVEHILTKLGFTGRAQVGAWVADRAGRDG